MTPDLTAPFDPTRALDDHAGLVAGVPDVVYHAHGGLSASRMRTLAESPARLRAQLDRRADPNPGRTAAPRGPRARTAQRIGHAAHLAVLEPELYAERAGALSAPDRRVCDGIARSVHAHPTAGPLLATGGHAELTALWEMEAQHPTHPARFGCKARIDYAADGVLLDLKTTRDAGRGAFGRSIRTWGYHRQLAWYRYALRRHGWPVERVAIVAVEKTPPYPTRVYELDEAALAAGEREIRELLGVYARCVATGTWPAYRGELGPLDRAA